MSTSPYVLMPLGLVVGLLMGLTSFTGAVIVPALVLSFGMFQARAQGTAVALTLSPLQLPALWNFHRAGNVDWRFMAWMAPGVVVGTFLGSMLANRLPAPVLKTIFGVMMVYVGAYMLMLLTTPRVGKAVVMAMVVALFAGAMLAASRWHEARTSVAAQARS